MSNRVASVAKSRSKYDCHYNDPKEPIGYLQWHAWADEQMKKGREQKQCPHCQFFYWPKEAKL